jgi:hypothetical protein
MKMVFLAGQKQAEKLVTFGPQHSLLPRVYLLVPKLNSLHHHDTAAEVVQVIRPGNSQQ